MRIISVTDFEGTDWDESKAGEASDVLIGQGSPVIISVEHMQIAGDFRTDHDSEFGFKSVTI